MSEPTVKDFVAAYHEREAHKEKLYESVKSLEAERDALKVEVERLRVISSSEEDRALYRLAAQKAAVVAMLRGLQDEHLNPSYGRSALDKAIAAVEAIK